MLILIAGVFAYANSFAGIFVFDDEPALAQNPNLGRLWPLTAAVSAPADTTLSGRPVATLSFSIDHALTGGSLAGYHRTNLLIHLLASLLVFGITRFTLLTPALTDRFGGSATVLAAIVALLFVVHPLQTASVTYIVQRVESLMGLFYLATLYCAIRALNEPGQASRGPWTAGSILACALGMGTKEVMATAPLMVMLWDRLFGADRATSRRMLYSGLAATWVILALLVAGLPRALSVGFGFPDWPWWRYLLTQAEVVALYLRLSFVPTPLVLDYEWPAAASLAQVAAPAAVVSVLLILTLWGCLKRSPAVFPGIWFFLILAPTSTVIPIVTEVAAEHRMYLPLAGVISLVVVGIFWVGCSLEQTLSPKAQLRSAWAFLVLAAAVIVVFGWMTHERNALYQDYDRIWSDTIAKRPRNARARNNYATSLLTQGRYFEAEGHLRAALSEKPASADTEVNLGTALSAQGKLDEGALHLRRAIELRPGDGGAHRNLGETYAMQYRLSEAAAHYAKALESAPNDVVLLNRLGWILSTAEDDLLRDGERARSLAERAVQLTGRQDPASLDALGAALAELGLYSAAEAAAREARNLAERGSDRGFVSELAARATLYSRGQKFRER